MPVEHDTRETMADARYSKAIGLEKQITIMGLLERAKMCSCADGIALKNERLGRMTGCSMPVLYGALERQRQTVISITLTHDMFPHREIERAIERTKSRMVAF